MRCNTLVLGCAVAALSIAGCAIDHTLEAGDGGPLPRDAGDRGVDGSGVPAAAHTYVVGLILTATNDGATAYGFDVDHMHDGMPGSCTDAADFVDPYDATNSSVDNQMSTALPTLGGMLGPDGADGAIRDQIESGAFLLVLEVAGIDSFLDDPAVTVHVVLARTQTAARPSVSTVCAAHADSASCTGDVPNACAWSISALACSGIASGQTFRTQMDLGTAAGSIANGRLAAVLDVLPLTLGRIVLPLHTAHVIGRITPTTLTGELGGSVLVSDIIATVAALGLMIDLGTLESFFSPDLAPNAGGSHCAAVSAGLGYTAIAATLAP